MGQFTKQIEETPPGKLIIIEPEIRLVYYDWLSPVTNPKSLSFVQFYGDNPPKPQYSFNYQPVMKKALPPPRIKYEPVKSTLINTPVIMEDIYAKYAPMYNQPQIMH